MSAPAEVTVITSAFLSEVDARLPGRLAGLFLHCSLAWGEFFSGSDIDFVGVWDGLPTGEDLHLLGEAHGATSGRHAGIAFDGFHCTRDDLAKDPVEVGTRPVFYQREFVPDGTLDINQVTWCELAQRPILIRGTVPPVRCDTRALVEFTRTNLGTYWRGQLEKVEKAGDERVGTADWAIAWFSLGAARLHYVLRHRELTSKSGAGRYLRDLHDSRWELLAREALRIREDEPDRVSCTA